MHFGLGSPIAVTFERSSSRDSSEPRFPSLFFTVETHGDDFEMVAVGDEPSECADSLLQEAPEEEDEEEP